MIVSEAEEKFKEKLKGMTLEELRGLHQKYLDMEFYTHCLLIKNEIERAEQEKNN